LFWGAEQTPATDSAIILATPDTIADAIPVFVNENRGL
jgi:hypothetical protein